MAVRKDGRGRPRGARFPHAIPISFSTEQWRALDTLAEQANVSIASLVRECVDANLPRIRQRIRQRKRRADEKAAE